MRGSAGTRRGHQAFDRTLAVDDLSFSVEGEVFGFLGGNGAGKTTTLRMALDIIRPTSGRIDVLGRAPGRANAPDIGFLPEERGLYRQMTALDTIVYFGRLKGMTAARRADRRAWRCSTASASATMRARPSTSCRRAWRRRSSSRPRW